MYWKNHESSLVWKSSSQCGLMRLFTLANNGTNEHKQQYSRFLYQTWVLLPF